MPGATKCAASFLSARKSRHLRAPGRPSKPFEAAGTQPIERARILTSRRDGLAMPLPAPGFALSRQSLDALMWRECRDNGVETREQTRVAHLEATELGYGIGAAHDKATTEFLGARFVIDATGRNARL